MVTFRPFSVREDSGQEGKARSLPCLEGLAVRFPGDAGFEAGPGFGEKGEGFRRVHQTEEFCQRVRHGAGGSDQGGLTRNGGAKAGAGIDDVAVTFAVDLHELIKVAGGRGIGFLQCDPDRAFLTGGLQADFPMVLCGGRGPGGDFAGGIKKHTGDLEAVAQEFQAGVLGPAFGNTAEVELHPGFDKADGAVGLVEFHGLPATADAGLGEGVRLWKFAPAAAAAPEADAGGEGNIEQPVAEGGNFTGTMQDVEQFPTDRHGGILASLGAKVIQFAGGFVVAENEVEPGNFGKDGIGGRGGGGGRESWQGEGPKAPHVGLATGPRP